jgi:hypothetical protein
MTIRPHTASLTNYLRDLFMGKPASVIARAYKEFWAQNRVEGHTLLATLSISLGCGKK